MGTAHAQDGQGQPHLFLCDGYAASAEALQAASLAPAVDAHATMTLLSEHFELPLEKECRLARLDPEAPDFGAGLAQLFGQPLGDEQVGEYRRCLRDMREANLPVGPRVIRADDFFPEKQWRVLAATGYMGPDPYTGLPGVTQLDEQRFQVSAQVATGGARQKVTFVFRLLASLPQRRLVFSPLLERFISGEDYRARAVKVPDSGRIRNELQTLCSPALEYRDDTIRVHFDRIDDLVMRPEKKDAIRRVLQWYRENHPVWFSWLEIA